MSTLDDALRQLAAVPPKAFTRERDALARSLREGGDAKVAAAVKSRRAPTVPVWIVNRLALDHPDDVEAYLDAADRVKSAQLGRAGSLSSATAAHRTALERLRSRADAMLRAAKIATGPDKVARIQNTLAGAAANADTRKALRAGLIEQELMAPGFDVFGGAQPVAARPAKAKDEPAHAKAKTERRSTARDEDESAAERRKREAEEQEERERAEREAAHRERVEAARSALRGSEVAAKAAHERVEAAEAKLHEAQERVKAAREAVGEAHAEARRHDAEVKRAHAALETAQRAKT